MRGQVRSQLCFIANRFKSPVAQGTGDVRVDVPWVLTRVPTFPPLLTQITESNNHLCGMCIRLCVGRPPVLGTRGRQCSERHHQTPSAFRGLTSHVTLHIPARHPSHTSSPKQPHETSATAHCPDETEEGREGGEENGDPVYETCASQTTSQFLGDVFNI